MRNLIASAVTKEEQIKGYPVPDGWKGWFNGAYRLFSTEDEYKEACQEQYGI